MTFWKRWRKAMLRGGKRSTGKAPEDCHVATITSSLLQGEVCPLDCRETEGEAGYGFVS
jgi:hypothetical protein